MHKIFSKTILWQCKCFFWIEWWEQRNTEEEIKRVMSIVMGAVKQVSVLTVNMDTLAKSHIVSFLRLPLWTTLCAYVCVSLGQGKTLGPASCLLPESNWQSCWGISSPTDWLIVWTFTRRYWLYTGRRHMRTHTQSTFSSCIFQKLVLSLIIIIQGGLQCFQETFRQ